MRRARRGLLLAVVLAAVFVPAANTSSTYVCDTDTCTPPGIDAWLGWTQDANVNEGWQAAYGGYCVHSAWRAKWGYWPAATTLILHSRVCSARLGSTINYYNAWVETGGNCGVDGREWHVVWGGKGTYSVSIIGLAYFTCQTPVPWAPSHRTRTLQVTSSTNTIPSSWPVAHS